MRNLTIVAAVCAALAGCGSGGASSSSSPAPTSSPAAVPAPAGPVVFIGDSITYRWNLAGDADPLLGQLIPGAVDAGVSGQTSEQMLARFAGDVLALHPTTVVILAGTNDLRLQANPDTGAVAEMAAEASAAGARVVLGKIPGSPLLYNDTAGGDSTLTAANNDAQIRAWNVQLGLLANAYGYQVADYYGATLGADGKPDPALFVDGIHPTAAGYVRMWAQLKGAL